MARTRVVVAMSGGVDSSVAACLLHQAGYDVVGVTMRLWTNEDPSAPPHQRRCCGIEDVDDARRVAQIAGFPHYYINFEREFQQQVVDYFVQEYRRGRTPHPCIACNDKLKFASLLRHALAWEAEFIATGHYARLAHSDGRYHLLKARDAGKDQSYVLYNLAQEQLRHILFPLGDMTKEQARDVAAQFGLPVAAKPDSQEICFIPRGTYRDFVAKQGTQRPGDIVDESGRVLGKHHGIESYTVGQRRGLGLTSERPYYVVRIDAERNQVVVGTDDALCHRRLVAERVSYVSGQAPVGLASVTAKIRYKASEATATLHALADGCAELAFDEPQRAITPGQAVVFYQGEEVLGGGTIARVVTEGEATRTLAAVTAGS
ncbi:MAG: tRNA 2-thiouridine(34) synthase MnmA [Chloroflexi bacterium]|nr:tRNA 2-thiouridine(34) synthase MnmA [Chloroflexota bacterium]